MVEDVTSEQVKESLVLSGPGSPASYTFTVSGGRPVATHGGAEVRDITGALLGVIPAPTLALSGRGHAASTDRSHLKMTVAGSKVSVSVSRAWLASLPRSAFPVVIDPTYFPPSAGPTAAKSFTWNGGSSSTATVGGSGSAHWAASVNIPLPAAPATTAGQQPWVLESATFRADPTCSGGQCSFANEVVYGLAGPPSNIGSILAGAVAYQQSASAQVSDFISDITPWVVAHPAGSWLGFDADAYSGSTPMALSFNPSLIEVDLDFNQQPPPVPLVSPASGAAVPTATPTLTTRTASTICQYSGQTSTDGCDPPDNLIYDFQVSASAPALTVSVVADSGWINQPYTLGGTATSSGYPIVPGTPSWTVPVGALVDGASYSVTVRVANTSQDPYDLWLTHGRIVAPAAPLPATSFTVKRRLAGGGPSPTDTVGTPPGQTSTPSQGAPGLGASPSSETVNMVTGNLAVSVGTGAMTALGGPAGVSLIYNSRESDHSSTGSSDTGTFGLRASFYPDAGTHAFPAGSVGTRVDPQVDTTTTSYTGSPIGGLGRGQNYLVRWRGNITPAVGTWKVGGIAASAGMRIYLDGGSTPVYDDWNGSASSFGFGSPTIAGGTTHQLVVEAWVNSSHQNAVQLWAEDTSSNGVLVPSTWLTQQANGLPPGWSINATGTPWTSLDDLGQEVVVQSSRGVTERFMSTPDGYAPEPGVSDTLTAVNGQLQLANAGWLSVFDGDGHLVKATTTTDDLHPATLSYAYGPADTSSGSPVVLQSITDPLSGRTVTLSYGATCAGPTGLLCRIAFWDGTNTSLAYNSNAQLAKVTSQGGKVTGLGYDAAGRLATVRDALASDVIAAAQPGTTGCATGAPCAVDTQITYDSAGRVATITQPAPYAGAPRPQRTYTYQPSTTNPGAGSTLIAIAGFTPPGNANIPAGQAAAVTYDNNSRITTRTSSTGLSSHTVWDALDRPIVVMDEPGLQTSSVYDSDSNVTDTYGPAPARCFAASSWPADLPAPESPIVGYLPVPDPAGTAGCGVASVPHTHTGYDEGTPGLANTFWGNGTRAGTPALHTTGIPNATPNCTVTKSIPYSYFANDYPSGVPTDLCGAWAAGSPPVTPDPATGEWSARLSGRINWSASDTFDFFALCADEPATVYIDSVAAVSTVDIGDPDYPDGYVWCGFYEHDMTTGTHTITLDITGTAAKASTYALIYQPGSRNPNGTASPGPWHGISATQLSPAYGLKTSAIDADGKKTATSYRSNQIDPAYGLTTASTPDPDGLALTTATGYTTNDGSLDPYHRRTSTTLPAGNTTSYAYYGPSETASTLISTTTCGVTPSTPQGGELQTQAEAAPSPGAPARTQQFLYDAAGRQAGRRIGLATTITSAAWQCAYYDADGRITSQTWPGRTVTYLYSYGGNPRSSAVVDSSGTISSTVDQLGRLVSYTDATGQATTVSYNQAGQVTESNGPGGDLTTTYDPTGARLSTISNAGTVLATAHYDTSSGRLTSISYSNGTTGTYGYDALGRTNSLVFKKTSTGALVTGNETTASLAGRITSELENINGTSLTNPNPAGQTATDYTYDASGRLISGYLPNGYATYGYANNPATDGCSFPGEGANTNRTSVTLAPASGTPTTTHYCYNNADQLNKTIAPSGTSTQYSFDGHGNQTNDNGTTLTWDAADRLATTTSSGTSTTYSYDAVNRVIAKTTAGATIKYAYSGFSDIPSATLDSANSVLQQLIALPGGVTETVQNSGNVWSYPDLHGNYTVTTDNTGAPQGTPATYDPWGQPTPGTTQPANLAGPTKLGVAGTSGKLTDTNTGITIMGARPYSAAEARFLSADPVEGGCANKYVYAAGDPFTQHDLNGEDYCLFTITAEQAIAWGSVLKAGGTWADLAETETPPAGPIVTAIKAIVRILGTSAKAIGSALLGAGAAAEAGALLVDGQGFVDVGLKTFLKVPYNVYVDPWVLADRPTPGFSNRGRGKC